MADVIDEFPDESEPFDDVELSPDTSDEDVLDRLDALEARLNSFPLPQPLFQVFPVSLGSGNTWSEIVPVNGTLTAGGQRTFTGDTSSGAALITLGANQAIVLESKEPGTVRFIQFSASTSSSYLRLTGIASTTNATTWVYSIAFPDGSTGSGYNGMEWNGTNPSMIQGSPGSLGVTVGTDGSVTGTSCFVQPLGVTGWVPAIFDAATSHWTFALPNSAG